VRTDTLVIGCGIAGATVALELSADREREITLLTRADRPEDSASSRAQGGIVGLGEDDTPELLGRDVEAAGAGLSRPDAVRILTEEGPAALHDLLVGRLGVAFDREPSGRPDFGLEAAHSRRRVLHVGDATGRAIMSAALAALGERPNVRLLTGRTAVDLITVPHHALDPLAIYGRPVCHGAYVLDRARGGVEPVVARHTVLATGGLGQVFLRTTNPEGARGDGFAMAHRAGASVIHMEFVQFHPTALYMPGPTQYLISEALRGEGGVLRTLDGARFMERYASESGDLAARDVVARAIYAEMLARDDPYVHLDIASQRDADFIRRRFPEIHARCLEHRIDITRDPIPVVPAAHYACGGVLVDAWGRTTLPGLWAVGEVACTGLHGANRLASTSLLEGLVWGRRVAADLRRAGASGRVPSERDVRRWELPEPSVAPDTARVRSDVQAVRSLMWHHVGLVRNARGLERATRELLRLRIEVEDLYRTGAPTDALVGLRNMALTALLVARAALRNRHGRGCHFREDAPNPTAPATAPHGDGSATTRFPPSAKSDTREREYRLRRGHSRCGDGQ
jgi:L-aspartate oxidase